MPEAASRLRLALCRRWLGVHDAPLPNTVQNKFSEGRRPPSVKSRSLLLTFGIQRCRRLILPGHRRVFEAALWSSCSQVSPLWSWVQPDRACGVSS